MPEYNGNIANQLVQAEKSRKNLADLKKFLLKELRSQPLDENLTAAIAAKKVLDKLFPTSTTSPQPSPKKTEAEKALNQFAQELDSERNALIHAYQTVERVLERREQFFKKNQTQQTNAIREHNFTLGQTRPAPNPGQSYAGEKELKEYYQKYGANLDIFNPNTRTELYENMAKTIDLDRMVKHDTTLKEDQKKALTELQTNLEKAGKALRPIWEKQEEQAFQKKKTENDQAYIKQLHEALQYTTAARLAIAEQYNAILAHSDPKNMAEKKEALQKMHTTLNINENQLRKDLKDAKENVPDYKESQLPKQMDTLYSNQSQKLTYYKLNGKGVPKKQTYGKNVSAEQIDRAIIQWNKENPNNPIPPRKNNFFGKGWSLTTGSPEKLEQFMGTVDRIVRSDATASQQAQAALTVGQPTPTTSTTPTAQASATAGATSQATQQQTQPTVIPAAASGVRHGSTTPTPIPSKTPNPG